MNREFKFRAWLPEDDVFEARMVTDWFNSEIFHESRINSKAIVMQYTGLKDKNGTEIYEGDIIAHTASDTKNYGVVFNNLIEYTTKGGLCGFRMKNGKFTKPLRRNNILGDVVVGNMYEHPHLLNRKNEPDNTGSR